MKTDINTVKQLLHQKMYFLKENYGVTELGIFGSVARGDNTEKSDIDILVTISKPMGYFEFIDLEEYLTELLGKKVDLVTKRALNRHIKDDILQQVTYV
jgi:predicted nucleotidyltransferase